jgi:DNA-binding FadR family transcriptional regulator
MPASAASSAFAAFAPIAPRESAVDACAASIRRAILTGDLAPGTRLPPERTLAKTFGVNRVTVRSALAQLAARHLLSVRQGSGYRVQDFRRAGGPDLLPGLASATDRAADRVDLARDLLLVRRHLARAVLERVAAAAGPADRARITTRVGDLARVVEAGAAAAQVAEADLAILAAILDATGSPVLGLCLNPVMAVLADLPELRDAMYAEPATNVAAYRLLLAWLERPDARALEPILAELARRDQGTLTRMSAATRRPGPRTRTRTRTRTRRRTRRRRKPR